MILLSTGGVNGGGYQASKYVVIALHGGILFTHAVLNCLPVSYLSIFGQFAALWNLVGKITFLVLFLLAFYFHIRCSLRPSVKSVINLG